MEQKQLRDLEEKCIQEQAPACTSACPANVDGRAIMAAVSGGDFTSAYKIFRKSIPFPAIISRVCDQPCRLTCLRKDAGDAIQIGLVERACTTYTAVREKITVLPRRNKRAAIIGAGLSGLMVGFDLAKKGYGVTIFEKAKVIGGSLRNIPGEILPENIIDEDLSLLTDMGVEFNLSYMVKSIDYSEEDNNYAVGDDSFDVLYIGVGANKEFNYGLATDASGGFQIDPVTYQTSRPGVFAGGGAVNRAPVFIGGTSFRLERSPVSAVSDGRRAANSIDRYLQRVSLTAGRMNEGVYPCRLFTSLAGVSPAPAIPVSQPQAGFSEEEAIQEASRCIRCECMECVKVCEYLKQYGSYPRRYVREIYNNISIVQGTRQKNQFINSCSLCGLCAEVCPEKLDMGQVCQAARRIMNQQERMPPSAHDFALRDMAFSNGEKFRLSRFQPGMNRNRYIFYPGCQLCASSPQTVEKTYSFLIKQLEAEHGGGIGLMLRCCGAPADWAGREDLLQSAKIEFLQEYEKLGQPEMVLACSSCYSIFKKYYPEVKITSLWSLFDRIGLPAESGLNTDIARNPITIHDPCTSRYEVEIQDHVRSILHKLGYDVEEPLLGRQKTECCGYGGLMWLANPALARDVIRRRNEENPHDTVTYCAMCRDFYASGGKPVYHLLDLIMNPAGAYQTGLKRGPFYSERRENRARLKKKLLKELWRDEMGADADFEKINLTFSPGVPEIMEERLILVEDIQRVIEHAEHNGRRLIHRNTGHFLAYYCPSLVTYWVEYSKNEGFFLIHNVYSHRMTIEEGGKK